VSRQYKKHTNFTINMDCFRRLESHDLIAVFDDVQLG